MVDTRPRTPLPTTIAYLAGAFLGAPAGDLGYHLTGLPPALGGLLVVLVSMVVAERLRRDHPTGVLRPRGRWRFRRPAERVPARDDALVSGAWSVAAALGWLLAIPAGPPFVRQGAGLVASVVIGIAWLVTGLAVAIVGTRRERRAAAGAE